jgi:hypothetical protein
VFKFWFELDIFQISKFEMCKTLSHPSLTKLKCWSMILKAGDSKLHRAVKKYLDVESIKWSKDCPEKYERGKNFLPNRIIRQLPYT